MPNNNTNYFGCPINSLLNFSGVYTKFQGETSLFFGILIIPFSFYYAYILIKLFNIYKDAFTWALISFSILILIVEILLVLIYFNFIFYCSNEIIYYLLMSFPLILATIVIFLFDYLICIILKTIFKLNRRLKYDLQGRINLIYIIKLPLIIIYSAQFIPIIITINFQIELDIVNKFYAIFSILYSFFYCIGLVINMNYFQQIIEANKSSIYHQIRTLMIITKVVLTLHFCIRLLYLISVTFWSLFISYNTWLDNLTDYCNQKGCIWSILFFFLERTFTILTIVIVFGIDINQFIILYKTKEKELHEIEFSIYRETEE